MLSVVFLVMKLTSIFFIHSDLEARRDVRKEEVNLPLSLYCFDIGVFNG